MNTFEQAPSPLLEAKKALGDSYERLNAAWRAAEEFLVSMHVGEEFHVNIYDEDESDDLDIWKSKEGIEGDYFPQRHWLAFCRWGGKWGLYYGMCSVVVSEPYDGYTSWRPILECTKEERLVAAEALPSLLDRALEAANQLRERVENAASVLNDALAKIKK